jgi:hypothetical protein
MILYASCAMQDALTAMVLFPQNAYLATKLPSFGHSVPPVAPAWTTTSKMERATFARSAMLVATFVQQHPRTAPAAILQLNIEISADRLVSAILTITRNCRLTTPALFATLAAKTVMGI